MKLCLLLYFQIRLLPLLGEQSDSREVSTKHPNQVRDAGEEWLLLNLDREGGVPQAWCSWLEVLSELLLGHDQGVPQLSGDEGEPWRGGRLHYSNN
jgi:hypothetical protein